MKQISQAMPHHLNAEKALLSQLYHGNQHLDSLNREDFYIEKHKLIFDIITDLQEKKMCDDVAFMHEVHKRKLYSQIDECDLLDLNIYTGEEGRTETFIKIVKDKATLRSIIKSASSLINTALSESDNVEEILEKSEQMIHKLASERSTSQTTQIRQVLQEAFRKITSIEVKANGVIGIPTGFKRLDELTTGFQESDLIILAARPSMGKTALAIQFAISIAQSNVPVLFFSLEMSSNSLAIRLLSATSGINSFNIKRYIEEAKGDFLHITRCAQQLSELPFYLDDTGGLNIGELKSRARKAFHEHGIKCIVIDYIQLITSARHYDNRVQEVADISRALKALAKELNIPIIALSQLSRKCEDRADKKPILSDIRESGAIEQDADLIMFLYRPIVYNPHCDFPDLAELIIGKQRNGPIDTVNLRFIKHLTWFQEWNEEPEKHWTERD